VTELHFLRPAWLLAIPLVLLFVAMLWRSRSAAHNWRRVCDPHLLPQLLVGAGGGRLGWVAGLVAVAGILAAAALAGPAWERVEQPLVRTLYGRVMVLDLSRSMNATDVTPTRLVRAREKIAELLERSGDLQTGLVVFAGDAFAVAPLTDDHRTLVSILPVLEPDVMPSQGSRIDFGLQHARRLLKGGGVSDGEVVVVSDGLKGSHAINVAADLLDDGYRVSVLAVGTVAGGVIRLADGGLLRGLDGHVVRPAVTLEPLARLATAGGGQFVRLAANDADLDQLTANTAAWRRFAAVEEVERTSATWQDQGPWLVLALLPLAALAFRRGWLLMLPLLLIVAPQGPLSTASAARPATADGQGIDRCPDDASPGAVKQAVTLFRNGKYLEAAAFFACQDNTEAHYNRGTALARAWRFEQALAAFDQALVRDPEHLDALHNRSIVERLLKQRKSATSFELESGQPGRNAQSSADDLSPDGGQGGTGSTYGGSGADVGTVGTPYGPAPKGTAPEHGSGRPPTRSQTDNADAQPTETPARATISAGERVALEAALARIPDDPAHLWRQKLALKYWRRERTPPRRSDAW
jgi:Ca-activated chloride channel family protein